VQANRDAERNIYSVSDITRHIKVNLERTFGNLWIQGELSNVKRPSSGHIYLTLKDDKAQLPAVMFRGKARHLRFRPDDGTSVLVWGHITVYEPHGKYQLLVERMEPRGKGALQLAFEQLKQKLSREGLFAEERKKPLPLLPQRLGIVTSPSGAAIRDLCRVLHRRYPNLDVLVYPAQVQGGLAAAEIAKGVQVLNRLGGFDVIIVSRGGGSLEDLWPFNEESVARAIAASSIPVVSAVGHEIDFTISDFVADVRAPTPSAAAEMVVRRKDDFREHVAALLARLNKGSRFHLRELTSRLQRVAAREAFTAVRHGVERRAQQVDEATFRTRAAIERRITRLSKRLDETARRLDAQRLDKKLGQAGATLTALHARLDAAELAVRARAHQSFASVAAKLETLSPLAVLGRGYSLTWTAQGKLLRRATDVSVGDAVRVDLHRGRLDCRVEDVNETDEPT
jgi:exodeoxyribonuclease VII large subunit